MPARERVKLVRSLACVDAAIESIDKDQTVRRTLRILHPDIFTNGGDIRNENVPEADVCRELGIKLVDGLGEKVQSSSWLINRIAKPNGIGSSGNSLICEARTPGSAMPEDTKGKKEAESKDVEMKDADEKKDKDGKDAKKEKEEPPPKTPRTGLKQMILLEAIAQNLKTIAAGVTAGDPRVMGRVLRSFAQLRRTMEPEEFVDPARPNKAQYIAAVPPADAKPKEVEIKFPQLSKPYAPELEAYAVLSLVVKLSDKNEKEKSLETASALVLFLKTLNRRTLDFFNARAYFYLSLAYERCGRLSEIRPELLAAYRSACLRHDQMGQATLLNLLLRNYLAYNLYDQALKLVSKTSFPESRPNMQYARYLFYIGQIKAVQLEYSDSHSKLMQAIRKAPQTASAALGFKLAASKLAIVVELLMGGIPERSFFMQKELKEQLRPYYAITQAVRSGDLHAFKECTKTYEALFKKDKTLTLINRLRYNVIKTGLRSISLAYSKISLQDICTKLGLESPQDAAGVVAKAVVDGVIDATIDYDQQFVKSNQKLDLYHSCEPQKALHKRIAFCLQMHNDAVKAMAYPDENDNKDAEDPEEKREREKRELANIEDEEGEPCKLELAHH
eukprot:s4390_g2.t2